MRLFLHVAIHAAVPFVAHLVPEQAAKLTAAMGNTAAATTMLDVASQVWEFWKEHSSCLVVDDAPFDRLVCMRVATPFVSHLAPRQAATLTAAMGKTAAAITNVGRRIAGMQLLLTSTDSRVDYTPGLPLLPRL